MRILSHVTFHWITKTLKIAGGFSQSSDQSPVIEFYLLVFQNFSDLHAV